MIRRLSRTITFAGLAVVIAGCRHQPPPTPNSVPSNSATHPSSGPGPSASVTPVAEASRPDDRSAAERRRALLAALGERVRFDYNVADIRTEDRSILDVKAAILRANPALRIRITGNCDERGSDQYNIALGMRRAAAAKEYIVRATGVDGFRIDVSSLGREQPLDHGSDELAWARNRRDEFEILSGGQNLVGP